MPPMTIQEDPYRPPSAALEGGRGVGWESQAVPEPVVTLLAETRPWVRLMAILIFLGSGLALILTLVVGLGSTGGGTGAITALPMLAVALIYLMPALFMWRYAASIRQLQDGGGQAALEAALGHQKSFWKYVGVLAAVMIIVYSIAMVLGVVLGGLRR